jgi:predicted transcriptional regulator
MKPRLPRPTDAELAILRVLWERGPSTVRQVHDSLSGQRAIGYTTILKLMQIMADKGLVARDETDRTHIYAPRRKLVMQALSSKKSSPEELAQIRQLLDQSERGTR